MAEYLTPGEAARESGLTLDTLRYYERIGLLDRVARGPGGQRRYTASDLDWLDVIRYLRGSGMPIADLRRYAELSRGGEETVPARLALLVDHDTHVGQRLAELTAQRARLRDKIAWYREHVAGSAAGPPPSPAGVSQPARAS
jgi:DNA-binding transcriptional MerR regulator